MGEEEGNLDAVVWQWTVLLIALSTVSCEPEREVREREANALDDHPLYSGYAFGSSNKVIDVGVQPLLFPPSIITGEIEAAG